MRFLTSVGLSVHSESALAGSVHTDTPHSWNLCVEFNSLPHLSSYHTSGVCCECVSCRVDAGGIVSFLLGGIKMKLSKLVLVVKELVIWVL